MHFNKEVILEKNEKASANGMWVNIFKPLGKESVEYICPKYTSLYKVGGTLFINNFLSKSSLSRLFGNKQNRLIYNVPSSYFV